VTIAKEKFYPVEGYTASGVAHDLKLALHRRIDDMMYDVMGSVGWDACWSRFLPNACCVVERYAEKPPRAFDGKLCSSCLESPVDCECPFEAAEWYSAVADYSKIDILERSVVTFDDLADLRYRSAEDGMVELENEIRYSLQDSAQKTIEALLYKGKTW